MGSMFAQEPADKPRCSARKAIVRPFARVAAFAAMLGVFLLARRPLYDRLGHWPGFILSYVCGLTVYFAVRRFLRRNDGGASS